MATDLFHTVDIIEVMENYIESIRPSENIREKLDIGYSIEGQSVEIYEIRPQFRNPETKQQRLVAKATFIKTKKHWKVFWMRADLKWHSYSPTPTVTTIKEFVKLVDEDKHHCFWG